jgi:adenylylsulfate kinase
VCFVRVFSLCFVCVCFLAVCFVRIFCCFRGIAPLYSRMPQSRISSIAKFSYNTGFFLSPSGSRRGQASGDHRPTPHRLRTVPAGLHLRDEKKQATLRGASSCCRCRCRHHLGSLKNIAAVVVFSQQTLEKRSEDGRRPKAALTLVDADAADQLVCRSSRGVSPPPPPPAPGLELSGRSVVMAPPSGGCQLPNITWHQGCVGLEKRESLLRQKGCILWITGLSGAGKSTLACALENSLMAKGKLSYVLDGDNLRHGLSNNLGFSAADREENIRRVGEVAKLFSDAGLITIVSLISPYKRDRDFARALVQPGKFVEVYMKVPLEICEGRDCKGLYKMSRAGVLKGFTGVDDPYEEPDNPEIQVKATNAAGDFIPPDCMANTLITYLEQNGFLQGPF